MADSDLVPTEVDVLVVGAGLAGHAAALSAAESGASVCLLEKGSDFGGSSVKAGGVLVFAGTDLQARAGIVDDNTKLRDELLKVGKSKNDPEVVDAYLDHQLDTYNWLRNRGVEFNLSRSGVTDAVDRNHASLPGVATRALHQHVLAHSSVQYRSNAAVTRLGRLGNGRVGRALVDTGRNVVSIAARRGVILTSGGFVRNRELLETFAPQWTAAFKLGGEHNTGDGLLMACALGAGLADMAYIEASFGASIKHYPDLAERSDEETRLLYPNYKGAIIVNLEGRRFANELLNYKVLSSICVQQPHGIAFQMFDQKIMERSGSFPTPSGWRSALSQGYLRQGDAIDALANAIAVDPARLRFTVERYNSGTDLNDDPDFGRPIHDFGSPGGARIDTAPFYAFPCRPALTTTYCGSGSIGVCESAMFTASLYRGSTPPAKSSGVFMAPHI
ncbi:MAG TPA: FAD-dependent oxidoreductase [Steroidobacteraceae bacterium]